MKQTETYRLNQWEASDRILREDFNGDNARIEAALAGKLGRAELVREVVLDGYAFGVTMDLRDIDWSQWSIVLLEMVPVMTSSSVTTMSFGISGITATSRSAYAPAIKDPCMAVLFPLRDAERAVRALFFPGGAVMASKDPYSKITEVAGNTNYYTGMAAGSCLRMYGIR
nr:hypothetical protein [uncultured Oscillibacter sp.]